MHSLVRLGQDSGRRAIVAVMSLSLAVVVAASTSDRPARFMDEDRKRRDDEDANVR